MDSTRALRKYIAATGILMAIQYALGMYTALFTTFPEPDMPGKVDHAQMWGFAFSQPVLATHIVIAFVLLASAIGLVVRVWRLRMRRLYWPAWLGLGAIFGAWFSGATFVPYQLDWWSYAMSLFFLLAFASYTWAYLETREA